MLLYSLLTLLMLSSVSSVKIPQFLKERLENSQSVHDILHKFHVIYHSHHTNSHMTPSKTFPTASPKTQVRIMSGSLMRRMQTSGSVSAQELMSDDANHIDDHTVNQLSLIGSIRQGNDTCQLQSVCVPVPVDMEDPQVYVFPKCYETMQCVGSCCESYEKCHPHSIKYIERPIIKLVYTGNDMFMLNETVNITMEEHTSCSCYHCQNAPECKEGFRLDRSCQCVCSNDAEQDQCTGNRMWKEDTCECLCNPIPCVRGKHFDNKSCQCVHHQRNKHSKEIVIPKLTEKAIENLPKLQSRVVRGNN